jgi:LysR family nitrogen assimilation transcriptional regulator
MDVRQLRYFMRIAEKGSLSRAAGDLRVSQSSLSLHVANLERELGVDLLVRSRRGVGLTECGELLLNRARLIIGQIEATVEEIRSFAENPVGVVTLGLPGGVAAFFSAPLLMQLKIRYPKIALRIVDGATSRLVSWAQDKRVDLAMVTEIGTISTLGAERLLSETLYLVGAGPQRFGNAFALKAANLASVPLVLPSREHGMRLLVEDFAKSIGIELLVKFEVDALPAIKELVRSGFGCTFLPATAIKEEAARGEFWTVNIVEPALTRILTLVRPLKVKTNPASDAARAVIRDLVAKLVNNDEWPGTLLLKSPASTSLLTEHIDWL